MTIKTVFATVLCASGALAQGLQNYQPVTAERLKNPESGNWLTIRRTYDGWGYSPLDQITPANVQRLQPLWVFSTGSSSGHEAAPLINNGVMFVATPGSQVLAIDAKTGLLLWRFRRPLPQDVILMHPTSRGVALYGDKVYFATGDAFVVAIRREDWQGRLDHACSRE
jgi:alcohol dehydrogenase (cytochrome c)